MDENRKVYRNTDKMNKRFNKKLVFFFIIFILSITVTVSAVGICIANSDTIYPNTYINDINISGMAKEKAVTILEDVLLNSLTDKTIELSCSGVKSQLKLNDVSPVIDIPLTVDNAFKNGRNGNKLASAFKYFKSKFYKTVLPLEISIDDQALTQYINNFTNTFETEVKEYGYQLDGSILSIYKGKAGFKADINKVKKDIINSIKTLSFKGVDIELQTVKPKNLNLDEFYNEITSPAEDAYYTKDNGNIVAHQGKPQIVIDKSEIERAIKSKEDVYKITVKLIAPAKTKDFLEKMLFRDKLGSFTSSFSLSNAPRSSNVKLSASKINNFMLLPGEIFSYDKTVGPRTIANGFKEAGVYIGNKVESGIGGGICQASSTLYSAVLYSNLEIVARTNHSLPVSYMPDGQDATISEGYIDFKFKNDTDYPIRIVAITNGGSLTCELWGVKESGIDVKLEHEKSNITAPKEIKEADGNIPVGYKKISKKGSGGYTITSKRIVTKDGAVIKTENLSKSVYVASDTILLVNPADMNTPSGGLKPYSSSASSDAPNSYGSNNLDSEKPAPTGGNIQDSIGEPQTNTNPEQSENMTTSTNVPQQTNTPAPATIITTQ